MLSQPSSVPPCPCRSLESLLEWILETPVTLCKRITVFGNPEDVAEVLSGLRKVEKPLCRCGCHQGIPGRYHCFAVCCDQPNVLTARAQ